MMKITNLIFAVLFLLVLEGCGKEDGLTPSHADSQWFVIYDKPGEVNHLIYDVYKTYGVPIYYNDTIGSEERGVDAYGHPVIYYEVLKPGFLISAYYTSISYTLCADTNAMVKAVNLIREKVLPVYPSKLQKPVSYLLTDSIKSKERYSLYSEYTYVSLTTTVVGRLSEILKMNDLEQSYWAGRIVASVVTPQVLQHYEQELEAFYAVTDDGSDVTMKSFYASSAWLYRISNGWKHKYYDTDPRFFGFMEYKLDGYPHPSDPDMKVRSTVSKEEDVMYYVGAVYAYSLEEFESLHGEWPKCVEKFKLMQGIVTKFKSKFN